MGKDNNMESEHASMTSQAKTMALDYELTELCGQPLAQLVMYSTADEKDTYTSVQLGTTKNPRVLFAKKDGVFTSTEKDMMEFVNFIDTTDRFVTFRTWKFFWTNRGYEVSIDDKKVPENKSFSYDVGMQCTTCKYAIPRPEEAKRMFAPSFVCTCGAEGRRNIITSLVTNLILDVREFLRRANCNDKTASSNINSPYDSFLEDLIELEYHMKKAEEVLAIGYTEPERKIIMSFECYSKKTEEGQ